MTSDTAAMTAAQVLARRRSRLDAFFPSVMAADRMRTLFSERYPGELESTREWAGRAKAHEYAFFGRVYRGGDAIDWHRDPVTGARWPMTFHGDIPSSGGDSGFGDVKDVWEVSRHQFLIDLGKAAFLDNDLDASREVVAIVRSWTAANPYGMGVNWASPLEPAYRVLSWLWAYHLILPDESIQPDDHLVWLGSFLDAGHFLYRHLELYASPFNHLIGEATALYALGVLFPEFKESRRWRARGRAVLEGRLSRQFYADGGTVEQATLYHHATLGFYLVAALLGRRNGEEFSDAVWQAIERAIQFSMLMMQPDGLLPTIGDNDDGRPIQLERKPFFDFRAYQAMGAVLFGRQDFKFAAGRFHEDALWLLGPDSLDEFNALHASPPEATSVALNESGYYILRSAWSPRADYICFDCGEQAGDLRTDDVPSAAHGHADCLSVVVYLNGQAVLLDPGFFTYNGDEAWERRLRETPAHNTVSIDGLDQSVHLSKMSWTHVPTASIEQWSPRADQGWASGSHDGYLRRTGVTHRRYVWRRPGGYVVIFDELTGTGKHDVLVSFQLAPGAARLAEGRVDAAAATISWAGTVRLDASLTAGGAGPEGGWLSPSLGVRIAAPRLRLQGEMHGAAGIVTVLMPPDRGVVTGTWTAADTVHLIVEDAGGTWRDDVLALLPAARSGASGSDAALSAWRQAGGTIVERTSIGGTAMHPAPPNMAPARVGCGE